ncbi:hypothetical protein NADE_008131 [Nannochloris sp. 'desiccata']|nr:hypothetical protein NADE_008131 [Chlorella desiccata (nom. nud.)]
MYSLQNQLGGGEGTVGIYGTITTTGVAATLVALRGIPTGHVDIPSCLTDIGSGLGRPLLLAIDFDEAFGIEIDPAKCLKAKAFIPRCYKELTARNLINYRREKIRPTVCADVQNILKLPFCTHVYSFWEGFNEENKRDVGKLLRRSPYKFVYGIPTRFRSTVASAAVVELKANLKKDKKEPTGQTWERQLWHDVLRVFTNPQHPCNLKVSMLSLFNGSNSPPENMEQRDALKTVLAALEIEFLPFHKTTTMQLGLKKRWPRVTDWAMQHRDYDSRVLQRYSNSNSAYDAAIALEELLLSASRLLYSHYNSCFLKDNFTPEFCGRIGVFWNVCGRIWEVLHDAGATAMLAEFDSRLTLRQLHAVTRGISICYLARFQQALNEEETVFPIWEDLKEFAEHVFNGPILSPFCYFWWIFTSQILDLVTAKLAATTLSPESSGSELSLRATRLADSIYRQVKYDLAPLIMDEAIRVNDSALMAYAAFNYAEQIAIGLSPWIYDDVEAMLLSGKEFLRSCKPWIPPLYRKAIKADLETAAKVYLKAARLKYPASYLTVTLGSDIACDYAGAALAATSAKTRVAFQLRICANCGDEGRDMGICSGCKQMAYCCVSCQKTSWRLGHKADCTKIPSALQGN